MRAPDTKKPLYSTLDALNCLDYFGRTATYGQVFEVAAGVHATFIDAGHILGSASIFLELEEQNHTTSVLFSGDLGSAGHPLLRSPTTPPHAENVVMETTYGDRLHKQLGPSIDEFYAAITETFKRGGNVIIPTFALERAQELLYFLSAGRRSGSAHEVDAGISGFTDGDFGHGDLPTPSGVLRAGDREAISRRGMTHLVYRDCISRGRPPNPLR